MKLGRNDPCHCGSGRKYKKCCAAKDDDARAEELAAEAAARAATAEADEDQSAKEGAGAKRPRGTPKAGGPSSATGLPRKAQFRTRAV